MPPLCKLDVTLYRVLGSREMHRRGGIDERAGVQQAILTGARRVGFAEACDVIQAPRGKV